MSDCQRTDAIAMKVRSGHQFVDVDIAIRASDAFETLARQLERELAAALKAKDEAEQSLALGVEDAVSDMADIAAMRIRAEKAEAERDAAVKDAQRYRFRHSTYVDKDGYEYGYCKVRWKNGSVDSMLWATDEEIDKAITASRSSEATGAGDEAKNIQGAVSTLSNGAIMTIDAERWQMFCGLWAASTELRVTQEENGFWAIRQVEPAEDVTFRPLIGETPDATIDIAIAPSKREE
jgi:hypothetical protein